MPSGRGPEWPPSLGAPIQITDGGAVEARAPPLSHPAGASLRIPESPSKTGHRSVRDPSKEVAAWEAGDPGAV